MALQNSADSHFRFLFCVRDSLRLRFPPFLLLLFIFSSFVSAARAQFQSPFVFASDPKGIAVYTRNDATGVLTPIPGSPFPSKEAVTFLTLDFKGRFLFAANNATSKISMFSINTITGALLEVPASPFASGFTNTPMFLAPEITGQTLYVINFYGATGLVSSLESFQIDGVNQALVPSQTPAVDLPGFFVGGAVHPSGSAFYGYFNEAGPNNSDIASFLVFNSSTGTFTSNTLPAMSPALCFAMDSVGLHAVMARGATTGQLFIFGLNADGTLSQFSANVLVNEQPESVSFDTLGQYVYVTQSAGVSQLSTVHIYSPVSLAELPNSPLPSSFTSTASWLVDPSAPLIFADQVYQVSPANGSLTSLPGSNSLVPPAVFSLPPGSQPVEGPVAQLSATSFAFGSVTTGVASSAQTLTITNTGGQNLSINTLAIAGTNAADFSEQDTCHVPTALTPNQSCSATIVFTPSVTGTRSASLAITDNAAPPSESVTLTGTGVPQASAVTLVPGTLTFGSASSPITVGASTSSNVTVTDSGGLSLHISSVALSGANSADYSFSAPGCSAVIAPNSNCTISVTFLPLAAGLRSATITLTDDAPDSPQTIQMNGNAGLSQTPEVTLVPSTLTFGSVASPVAEGVSTYSNVVVTNSGGAPLHISNIAVSGTNSSEFTISAPSCTAIAVNSNCAIAVTFLPLSTGLRSATITLTDDAPTSPQTISISGNATSTITIAPAAGSSTTVTVTAGKTATYSLQIIPGAGYSGTISFTCTGAPVAATCNVPQSIVISNGAPTPFSVNVTTTAASMLLPFTKLPRTGPPAEYRLPIIAGGVMLLLYFVFGSNRGSTIRLRRLSWSYAVAGIVLCGVAAGLSGCGGGSSASNATSAVVPVPPPAFTPVGTFALVVTATPAAQGGKQLPAQTIQLTLTVN